VFGGGTQKLITDEDSPGSRTPVLQSLAPQPEGCISVVLFPKASPVAVCIAVPVALLHITPPKQQNPAEAGLGV